MKLATTLLPLLCLMGMFFSNQANAQTIPFDTLRWDIKAQEYRLEEHMGQPALYMKGGKATLKDESFTNGTIEFDVAFTGARGFMGGIWRVQDPYNYEEFYMRPHQSGKPDANQYTPVFNRLSAWQLYHGDGYGVPYTYENNTWFHVRIVVKSTRGEVYIGDSEEPNLVIHEMKRPVAAGGIGVSCSNFAPAHFANFSFTADDNPELKGEFKDFPAAPSGTIMEWAISSNIEEPGLPEVKNLTESLKEDLEWEVLSCESSGLANISRVSQFDQERNTVLARVIIDSGRDLTAELLFGYSDRARVFLNDQLLYAGQNNYRSRDFRYLGTIGLFDAVYLPLKTGENELWIAVSESFGGWGLMARLEDIDGVSVRIP